MSSRFDLADKEWAIIQPLLPNKPRSVPRVNDRTVLNDIFRVLRIGAPWKDMRSQQSSVNQSRIV